MSVPEGAYSMSADEAAARRDAAERVAAGAAFLDEHEPGWVERIDVDRLDLGSGCDCVLGQLEAPLLDPDYDDLGDAYAVGRRRRGVGLTQANDLGFNVDYHAEYEEYEELTATWRELIAARRGGEA